jgi:hypothetical protein
MPRPPITRTRPYAPRSGALAGQTFYSERQYRNALARRAGHRSWNAQQRAHKDVRSAEQWRVLRLSERAARDRALETVVLMRRERMTLTSAAMRAGTTRNTVLKYARTALARRPDGRYVAKRADRLFRRMRVLSPDGVTSVGIRGSRAAALAGEHASAIHHFLATGDDSRLRPVAGKRVAGVVLETDPTAIEAWARRGVLDFEDIYDLTT